MPAYEKYISYEVNDIFSVIIFARVIYLFKVMLTGSKYNSNKYYRIGRMKGVKIDAIFCLKALVISDPFIVYPLLLFMFVLFGTLGLAIAETPLVPINNVNFGNFWNSLWCVLITILTVGYGDFYPRTTYGRLIIVIVALAGNFLIGMLIATLTSILSLDRVEGQICGIINRLKLMEIKEKYAVDLVTDFFRLKMLVDEQNKLISKQEVSVEEKHLKNDEFDIVENKFHKSKT